MDRFQVSESAHPCGCFVKVYVCPEHLEVAAAELRDLTSQLNLAILDTMVSVSDMGEGERASA